MAALRTQLKPDQLGAAFHLAGVSPTPRSPVRNVGSVASAAAAKKALAGSGLIEGGGLTADAAAAMAVLADPRIGLVVVANRASDPAWAETVLLSRGEPGPFVIYADGAGAADVAILPRLSQAIVVLDELIGISLVPAVPGGEPVELDLVGFAALVAAADVLRQTELDRALERDADVTPVPLTVADLEAALERGMDATDARWAVDAARVLSPPMFATARGRMQAGLDGLVRAGLAAQRGRSGYELTAAGLNVAGALSRLIGSAAITVALAGDDGTVGVSHISIFRSVDSIWLVPWTTVSGSDATVSLFQASATTALRFLQSTIVPTPTGAPAPTAAPRKAAAKKATATAAPAAAPTAAPAAPAPAPTPAAAPATAAVWTPTHVIPAGGLDAYEEPGASSPVAALDAALPVRLDEELGAWAHITCSNGWQAWVDGRYLEPAG